MNSLSVNSALLADLKHEVAHSLNVYLAKANAALGTMFVLPAVQYRNKGSVAGTAHLAHWKIQLNTPMLLEHGSAFIDEVVPHELAHLLVFALYGRVKPHGPEWQQMMNNVFGRAPKRTHQFTNPLTQSTKFAYTCPCQQHFLSTIRHRKVQLNQIEYRCTQCKGKLTFQN